jgi:hypothetical protein
MIDVEETEVDVETKDESESGLGRKEIRVVPRHRLSTFFHAPVPYVPLDFTKLPNHTAESFEQRLGHAIPVAIAIPLILLLLFPRQYSDCFRPASNRSGFHFHQHTVS